MPQSLRGDLSKWMQEIATGVYIGNFNSKVREQLWNRVKENIGDGEASLSYYYRNEIGYDFKTINTNRQVVDSDGIPLVLLPNNESNENNNLKKGFSKASKFRNLKKYSSNKTKANKKLENFIILDIETDGLDPETNEIIEIGAIKFIGGEEFEFNQLVKYNKKLPDEIKKLTSIKDEDLKNAREIEFILDELIEFIGDLPIIGYNIGFDIKFLNKNLRDYEKTRIGNKSLDLIEVVKRENLFLKNYKLSTALKAYGLDDKVEHRALSDCRKTYELFLKVNKNL